MDEVIELVGATDYAPRPIGQMSGGEQQRLLIAQALVRRPRLLLLDEPLDSLDLPNQASVAALISDISQEFGITVLIVAHDVNPIVSYLDGVVYVARGGRSSGPPDEVITSATLVPLRHPDRGAAAIRRPTGGGRATRSARPPRRPPRHTTTTTSDGHRLTSAVTRLTWNLSSDLRQMLALHFMVNAFRAGTMVAVIAAAIGWFMVLAAPELRRPHPGRGVLPGRRRRRLARDQRHRRLLRREHRRRRW